MMIMIVQPVSRPTLALFLNNKDYIGGSDYVAGPYPIMIPAGGTTGSYEISVVVDNMLESEELFQLTIDTNTLPHGIILGSPDSATVTIRNDDSKC